MRSGGAQRGLGVVVTLAATTLAAACLLAGMGTPPSEAAFPGKPGKIVWIGQPAVEELGLDIYIMNADGSGQEKLTESHPDDPPGADRHPAFSADGRRIAFDSNRFFVVNDNDYDIFVMNRDGSGEKRLRGPPSFDNHPAFSPDGQRIVFTSDRDGDFEIFVMNRDGSGQKKLTHNVARDAFPVFSPDGRRIAFASERDGDFEIVVMRSDGSRQRQLTFNAATPGSHDADDAVPDFSPDGRRIAFASERDGDREIFVMNANGSAPRQLTFNDETPSTPEADDAAPVFSPDGRRIAFHSNRDGDYEIFVMNADGSGQTQLTYDPGFDRLPDWQPLPSKCGGKRATLTGTPGGDRLRGTRRADVILGLGGNDRIAGLSGNDRLCGGKGRDKLLGGPGKDILRGGPKPDVLRGGKGSDRCLGGKGRDRASGCQVTQN